MAKKPTYEELEKSVKELHKVASKRNRAKKALRESGGRLRSLIENSPDTKPITLQRLLKEVDNVLKQPIEVET